MVRVWCQGVQCSGELGTGSGSGHFPSGQRLFGHLVWLLGQGTISCSSQVCVESPLLLLGMGQDGAFTAGKVSHAQDRRDPKDTLGPCFGSCTAWRQLCSSCCSPGMQQLCSSCYSPMECSSCAAPALHQNAAAVQPLPFTGMQPLVALAGDRTGDVSGTEVVAQAVPHSVQSAEGLCVLRMRCQVKPPHLGDPGAPGTQSLAQPGPGLTELVPSPAIPVPPWRAGPWLLDAAPGTAAGPWERKSLGFVLSCLVLCEEHCHEQLKASLGTC